MSKTYSSAVKATNATPQTRPAFGREAEQVKNNAGGYVFAVSPLQHLRRFLILGSESGTYYVSERKHTASNLTNVKAVLDSPDGPDAIKILLSISHEGLAPKVSPTLLTLAVAFTSSNRETRRAAARVFNDVVRTQSHLFEFVSYANELRGWGRTLRETVAKWYASKSTETLAYQMTKYRERNSWSTKDVLRMAHPKPQDAGQDALYRWAVGKDESLEGTLPDIVHSYELAKKYAGDPQRIVRLIESAGLTREMVPTEALNSPEVWEALLEKMPLTAMIRSLAKMTHVGILGNLKGTSNAVETVVARLADQIYIKRSRVHPLGILLARAAYGAGRGFRGSLKWTPSKRVLDALDEAYYLAFGNVRASGKNMLLAIDISGSMSIPVAGSFLSCRDGAAAMAMATLRSEPWCETVAFSDPTGRDRWRMTASKVLPLPLTPKMQLPHVQSEIKKLTPYFVGTDCALPMLHAIENRLEVDTFVVYTDNETWASEIHPFQALKRYRKEMSRPHARLVVVGMASNGFTIADPSDSGMLDVVGFDASTPTVISGFSAGDI